VVVAGIRGGLGGGREKGWMMTRRMTASHAARLFFMRTFLSRVRFYLNDPTPSSYALLPRR